MSMTCQELVEVVTEYLEGTLPPPERARFEAHIEACEGCRNYLDQMRQTIVLMGKLTEESLTPRAKQDLLSLFQHWKQG